MAINDKPSAVVSFNAVPADAPDPDVKVYVNGELVESGGGGGGDYQIFKVTFSESSLNDFACAAFRFDGEGGGASSGKIVITPGNTYDVIAYGGTAAIAAGKTNGYIEVVSGDATEDGDLAVATGDCVLTLKQIG